MLKARWNVVNKLWARSAGVSSYAPLASWAYLRTPAQVNMRELLNTRLGITVRSPGPGPVTPITGKVRIAGIEGTGTWVVAEPDRLCHLPLKPIWPPAGCG